MRIFFRRIAVVLLGAMLFAQAALALSACEWPKRSPANAFADAPTCHEEPARNSNLCLSHCLSEDQSLDLPQVKVHALPASVVLVLEPRLQLAPAVQTAWHEVAVPRPPPRILFQSLLI
jgi:hypothetical protein